MNGHHLQRAVLLAASGRDREAAREYVTQLSLTPDDGWVHGLLAMCLARVANFEGALFHAQEAMRLLPETGWAYFVMGCVFGQQGKYSHAGDWVEQAIQREPENPAYFQMLGSIRIKERRREAALEAINKCLEIDPQNIHAMNLRSAVLRFKWDQSAADEAALAALAIAPENSLAHVNYGLLFVTTGSYSQAFAEFKEALRLDPCSIDAQVGINQTRSARAISILIAFMATVALFLSFVAFSAGALGCSQFCLMAMLLLIAALLWRHRGLVLWRSR